MEGCLVGGHAGQTFSTSGPLDVTKRRESFKIEVLQKPKCN